MDSWTLLLDVIVLLASCLILGAIFSRLGQNALVGYLLAGMLVGGPGSLRLVKATDHIETIAELGVSLLLFSLGLEFSWRRLGHLGARNLAAGAIQVALTVVFAAFVASLFHLPLVEAVALGAMVSVSSTACVLQVLDDRGERDSAYGRSSVAILLVQDVAVIPLALLVALLAGRDSASAAALRLGTMVILAGALALLFYVVLKRVAVGILGSLPLRRNRELAVLLAATVGLGSSWAAHAAELPPALGAFLAGLFLGGSPFATQIRADVSPFRVVLLTLFFGAVGMVADPRWIGSNPALVLGLTAALIAGKVVIVSIVVRAVGQPGGVAIATGLVLAQTGEFAFLLGRIGAEAGVVGETAYAAIVSSAILTLFLTPYFVSAAPAFGRWVDKGFLPRVGLARGDEEQAPDVVIIGFGPAGMAVAGALAETDLSVAVIDLNRRSIRTAESMGFSGHLGDAQRPEVLEHARVDRARIVVVTLPARSAAITVAHEVRRLAPCAHVVARSRHKLHVGEFESAGAHAVYDDEEAVGAALAEHVLASLREEAGGSPCAEDEAQ